MDGQTDNGGFIDPLYMGSNYRHYRFGSVECDITTDVTEQNENIPSGTSHTSCKISINLKKIYPLSPNDKHISDNNTYDGTGIGQCKMDCVKEYLTERRKYYEKEKSSWFQEALCGSNILCNTKNT